MRREDVPVVRQQARNYERLRTLVDRCIGAAMELSRSRLREARSGRAK